MAQELSEQLTQLRETLVIDVTALEKRGLIDGRLGELRGAVGYKNLAFDVLLLSTVLRESWSKIEGKTGVQLAELDCADTLADRLVTAVGVREQGKSALSAAVEARQRAYTLFVNAYDEVRRAVGYLRFNHGDLEKIAPSLYSGRKPHRPEEEPIAGGAAVAPGTPPGVTPAATPPAAPPTGANGSNGGAATAPGMPGADPFGRR
jgi:hypothetical protein